MIEALFNRVAINLSTQFNTVGYFLIQIVIFLVLGMTSDFLLYPLIMSFSSMF